ncbi:hypothetical protein B0J18DRAFT_274895 [Chaetomium sp. MPI-SDFR-AT-0129]|nr:hypothetical protein B0J18DRAFT_274895 [Chaetomium sp. MPI-SDFR-AT-0129]
MAPSPTPSPKIASAKPVDRPEESHFPAILAELGAARCPSSTRPGTRQFAGYRGSLTSNRHEPVHCSILCCSAKRESSCAEVENCDGVGGIVLVMGSVVGQFRLEVGRSVGILGLAVIYRALVGGMYTVVFLRTSRGGHVGPAEHALSATVRRVRRDIQLWSRQQIRPFGRLSATPTASVDKFWGGNCG